MSVPLTRCPCGLSHDASEGVRALLATVEPNVPVRTIWGTWSVPRVFIAAHGLKAFELPMLARKYGFEKVVGA